MGFRVLILGLGYRVQVLGFWVQGLCLRYRVQGLAQSKPLLGFPYEIVSCCYMHKSNIDEKDTYAGAYVHTCILTGSQHIRRAGNSDCSRLGRDSILVYATTMFAIVPRFVQLSCNPAFTMSPGTSFAARSRLCGSSCKVYIVYIT